MDKIFLNKNWTMKRAGTDKIYSVEVPGSVYAHLLDIGEMKNSDIGFKGEESNPRYIAYLKPEFSIDMDKLADYRIKHIRPYETKVFKIMQYNPNLFLRHNRHHVKLVLRLEKKNE